MSHSQRAQSALAHLREGDPALALLSLWCRHHDADGHTKTRENTISYGLPFEPRNLVEQVEPVAYHVVHVALRHSDLQAALAERLGVEFDARLFGLAADGLNNETLLLAGHAFLRPAVLATDQLEVIGKPAQPNVQALSDWGADRLAMALHSGRKYLKRRENTKGRAAFWRIWGTDHPDDDQDASRTTDWRNQLVRAMEAGHKAGTGVGRFGGFLADLAQPGIPWDVQLRGLLATALSDMPQPTYSRPASRWIATAAHANINATPEPVFQLGRARDALRSRIVVGLDTSSFIDAMALSPFSRIKRRG